MTAEISFTNITNKSILTKVKVDYKYISIFTMTTGNKENEFVTISRINNADIQDPIILEVTTTHATDALMNHIALTKTVLENNHQGLTIEHLKQYCALYVADALNQMDIHPSADSFDTPFTKKLFEETIGYGAEEISDLNGSRYTKYALAALIAFFAFTYISLFNLGEI